MDISGGVFSSLIEIWTKAVNAYKTFGFSLNLSLRDVVESFDSDIANTLLDWFENLFQKGLFGVVMFIVTGEPDLFDITLLDFIFGNLIVICFIRVIIKVVNWVSVGIVGD